MREKKELDIMPNYIFGNRVDLIASRFTLESTTSVYNRIIVAMEKMARLGIDPVEAIEIMAKMEQIAHGEE